MPHRNVVAIVLVLVASAAVSEAADPVWGPWYRIGPLPGAKSLDTVFLPEKAVDLKQTVGTRRWERIDYTEGTIQRLPRGEHEAFYLYRTITCRRAAKVTTCYGGDDSFAVWLNGVEIIRDRTTHGVKPNQKTAVLALKAGTNHLLIKIYNWRGNCGWYFHTSDKPGKGAAGRAASPGKTTARTPDPQPKARKPKLKKAKVKKPKKRKPDIPPGEAKSDWPREVNLPALRLGIEDLVRTFGPRYPKGAEYLARLTALEKAWAAKKDDPALAAEFCKLRREALLANPLLDFDQVLLLKRNFGDRARKVMSASLGMPKLNSHSNNHIASPEKGWDNELVVLSDLRGKGTFRTVYKPPAGRIVVDPDLHFDADRVMFSMIADHGAWGVFEVPVTSGKARLLTPPQPDVDYYDSCYGVGDRIFFASTATMQGLPCQNGNGRVAQLFSMDLSDGTIRQITFEQDTDWCPTMLPSGRVMYLRWEYTDLPHYFSRILMSMNPDGTGQMEYYGSNSYFPNGIFNARPIPGPSGRVVGIISGHHGISRSGRMLIFDPAYGRHEAKGVVQEIPGRGKRVEPIIADRLVNGVWPQLIHPYPLSEKYFLVSVKATPGSLWGLYVVDVFDNATLIKEVETSALLEPIPLRKTAPPRLVSDKVLPARKDALVYLEDIYRGPGLEGVPQGTVKKLRLFAYHYGYNGTGGHASVGTESSWDIKRILGTVPVKPDGSALFRIPANTPISVQPLDADDRALQLMRSWLVAMPGEVLSCVGCHEPQNQAPRNAMRTALRGEVAEITPWYGRARTFGFRREVQPTLDRYCLACHDGSTKLTAGGAKKGAPSFVDKPDARGHSPAYEVLQAYVRRPGPESDLHLTTPLEYHASTSELVQMLHKGHHNVKLSREAWDRLYTWIDLNAPFYGSWAQTGRLKEFEGVDQRTRRAELARLYAGVSCDPEADANLPVPEVTPIKPEPLPSKPARKVTAPGWPFRASGEIKTQTLDLGEGVTMQLVRIPAGQFVMGDANGELDERPLTRVAIDKPFWMGKVEVTNQQYARFDPAHDSRYIDNGGKDQSTRGMPANMPDQPVIRISQQQAATFCRWLSEKTGRRVALPTEAQWEWACRAGTATPLWYGDPDSDFSRFANLADATALKSRNKGKKGGITPIPADGRFNDRQLIPGSVGSYQANPFGLYDMHGSVAEWTRTTCRRYPYSDTDGRNNTDGPKVVRGGSWRDRPKRARSAFRLSYPAWQRVENVGFRVVVED